MKITRTISLLVFCCVVMACASNTTAEQPTLNHAKGDLSDVTIVSQGYQDLHITAATVFSWLPAKVSEDPRLASDKINAFIHEAIENEMTRKGYTIRAESVASKVGYYITYTAGLESSLDDQTIFKRYGILPGRPSPINSQYEKGSLLIHVVDARSRKIVWQAAVQGDVDFTIADQQRKSRIQTLVTRMMKGLPF